MESNEYFDLTLGSVDGFRTASLNVKKGFPEQYIGLYEFKELSYGESIECQIEAESRRTVKVAELTNKLNILEKEKKYEEECVKLRAQLDELKEFDFKSLNILKTLRTLRKSPIKLTVESMNTMLGRLGVILDNISHDLNTMPIEEKKP